MALAVNSGHGAEKPRQLAKEATVFLKVQDEKTESALCVGTIAAVVWGIGLSMYGFHQGPQEISWTVWGIQLIGGILACLILPPAFVRGREWLLARTHSQHGPLHQQP
jgi:hypothetical protein